MSNAYSEPDRQVKFSVSMEHNVQIIFYEDRYHEAFRSLNMEWLERYGLAEEPDLIVLANPRGEILDKGGFVWLARQGDEVIGSSALIKEADNKYELAKMSVAPGWRGKGISKLLIEVCLEKAREVGAWKVELFSNHQLAPALKLYEQYGFQYVEVIDSPFQTADIKMELLMNKSKL